MSECCLQEKQAFERMAQVMIDTFQFNPWLQQTYDGINYPGHSNPDTPRFGEQPPPAVHMSVDPVRPQDQSGDKMPVKKQAKKAPAKKPKENADTVNDAETEKVDDAQMAWKLHVELNTKPRPGKRKPRAKSRVTKALSLPGQEKLPESISRRKQSRKDIRRSL